MTPSRREDDHPPAGLASATSPALGLPWSATLHAALRLAHARRPICTHSAVRWSPYGHTPDRVQPLLLWGVRRPDVLDPNSCERRSPPRRLTLRGTPTSPDGLPRHPVARRRGRGLAMAYPLTVTVKRVPPGRQGAPSFSWHCRAARGYRLIRHGRLHPARLDRLPCVGGSACWQGVRCGDRRKGEQSGSLLVAAVPDLSTVRAHGPRMDPRQVSRLRGDLVPFCYLPRTGPHRTGDTVTHGTRYRVRTPYLS